VVCSLSLQSGYEGPTLIIHAALPSLNFLAKSSFQHSRHNTTPALNRRSLRWFGLPTCIGEPGGPTSIADTARFVLVSSTSPSLSFQDTPLIAEYLALLTDPWVAE
jgi:hypothetical protein